VADKADEEIRGLKEGLSNMALTNYRFEENIEKLLKDLEIAENNVIDQHELSFQKALDQAAYFYKIPLDEGKFDIDKDFHEGKLLPIDEIPSAQEDVSAPSEVQDPGRVDLDGLVYVVLFG